MKKIFLLLTVFNSLCVQANRIQVPTDQPTIQQAILAGSNGDTVVVSPGTYYENLNFRGHHIVLTSLYYLAMDSSFICSTIINGSQPLYADTASCIILNSGEDSTTVIQGFTITGGAGTKWLDTHGAGTYREGGGIITENASPVIRWNRIRGNLVTNTTGVSGTGGGGIRCGDGHPLIYGNIIEYNRGGYGCGIVMNYCNNAKISNNIISHNAGGQNYGGGGIWATGTNTATTLFVENNTICNNHISGTGSYGGKGGGIFVFSIKLITKNNIVYNNTQSTGNAFITFFGGIIQASYSNISFSVTGTGNINVVPQFQDTALYVLNSSSPCIDAGDVSVVFNDQTVSAGVAMFPSMGTEHNDMGAYGGPLAMLFPACSIITSIADFKKEETAYMLYPNPISSESTLAYKNELVAGDGLTLINYLGETVAEFTVTADTKQYEINLRTLYISSGNYIVKVSRQKATLYHKIVVMP